MNLVKRMNINDLPQLFSTLDDYFADSISKVDQIKGHVSQIALLRPSLPQMQSCRRRLLALAAAFDRLCKSVIDDCDQSAGDDDHKES